MSSRVADEREQRRGLILGLTLAEVLLLLLFLLLLALASQIKFWRGEAEVARSKFAELDRTIEQLEPLQRALMLGGAAHITSVQELVIRFNHLQKLELEAARLQKENVMLLQEAAVARVLEPKSDEKRRMLAAMMKRATEMDPNDPPALLKRALDIMERLGPSTKPEQVRPISEMLGDTDLRQKFAELRQDSERVRSERDNLMRQGNGLTYPSCWRNANSATEYIFDITFTDKGVVVHNATPGRANDKAWSMVSSFARNSEINERTFLAATKPLFEWSKDQQCRFYSINRDSTGDVNKVRYKELRVAIESQFYPLYPPAPPQRAKKGDSKGSGTMSIGPQIVAPQPEDPSVRQSGEVPWGQ